MPRLTVVVATACLILPSCKMMDGLLGTSVPVVNAEGEQIGEVTVDEVITDSGVLEGGASLVGAITGNPLLGAGVAATLSAIFLGSRKRRKLNEQP